MWKLSVFRGFVWISRVLSMARLCALYNPRPNVAANSDQRFRAYGPNDEHSREPEVKEARGTTQSTLQDATDADASMGGDGGNDGGNVAIKHCGQSGNVPRYVPALKRT